MWGELALPCSKAWKDGTVGGVDFVLPAHLGSKQALGVFSDLKWLCIAAGLIQAGSGQTSSPLDHFALSRVDNPGELLLTLVIFAILQVETV